MSPYSSLNNTGIYDAGFGSAKSSFVGVGYDNVSQVDRWLSNVEYNLDQTEQAVQKRATAAPMTTTMSSLSLHSVASRSVAQAQDHATAIATSYNSRKYSAAQGGRYGDTENVSAKTYYSGSGQQQKKTAIVRSATIGGSGSVTGSLQRSQSLGRGQLASSLANLKARLGSRGSSRERMQQRFSANGVRSYSSAGGAHPSVGLSKASRFSASRERTSPLGMVDYRGEGGGVTTSRTNIAKAAIAGSERRKFLLKRTVSDPTGQLSNCNGVARAKSPQKLRNKLRNQTPPAPPAEEYSSYDLSTLSDVPGDMSGPENPSRSLCSCPTCNRTFNPKALEKHMKICEKVFKSKRPKFSSQDARLSGLENVVDTTNGLHARYNPRKSSLRGSRGAAHGRKSYDDRAIRTKASSKPKWKVQSEQFRAAMMAARGEDVTSMGGYGCGSGAVGGHIDDGLIPCPHCGRTFNETAAERHIERCKNIKARPKTLKAGGGRGAYSRNSSSSRSSSSSSYTTRF